MFRTLKPKTRASAICYISTHKLHSIAVDLRQTLRDTIHKTRLKDAGQPVGRGFPCL
jgi:hypothetical protein